MSNLLLDEQPLLVMPKLAAKIGLNESIILQQIHYWNEINRKANNNFREDYYWTFNSYDEWTKQFPFWSKRTIQRTITSLEKFRLVISDNFNKLKIDRTKWYRIDYKILEELDRFPCGQNGIINLTNWHNHIDNLELPLPETNPETNPENIFKGNESKITFGSLLNEYDLNHIENIGDVIEAVSYYHRLFNKYFDTELKYSHNEWNDILEGIFTNDTGQDANLQNIKDAIDKHFDTRYKHKQMYYLHNFKGSIKDNRLFESGIKCG